MVQKWTYYFNEVIFPTQQSAYDLLPKSFCKPGKHKWIEVNTPMKSNLKDEICGTCKLYRRQKKTTKKPKKKKTEKTQKKKGSELIDTFKYFWAWSRKNLTVKMIFFGAVGFILLIELIKGLFF